MSFKTNIYLNKGWNLISFFLENVDFDFISNNDNILEIKSINKNYNNKIPRILNTLKSLERGQGYWIKSKNKTVLEIEGKINKNNYKYKIKKGWNLIGYPFDISFEISKLDKKITEIKNLTKSYNSILPENLNTLKKFIPNEGFWAKSKEELEFDLEYPFIFVRKDTNNQLSGLIYWEEISLDNLETGYTKETYCLSDNQETNIEIPWNTKNLNYNEVNTIKESFKDFKFTVYYGDWNGEQRIVATEFHSKINIIDKLDGDIRINPVEFNDDLKYVEIYFNNKKDDKILLNITNNIVVVGYEGQFCFINNLTYKSIEDIVIKKVDPKEDTVFLTDYNLKNIEIKDLILMKNGKIVNANNFNSAYNFNSNQLMLKLNSKDEKHILYLETLDNSHKTMNFNFIQENGEYFKDKILIIFNKAINFKINDDVYVITFKWEGAIKNDISYVTYSYTESSNYLFWFDFREIEFNEISIDSYKLNNLNILERNKDYIIIESVGLSFTFKVIIIKDSIYNGCVNFTYKTKNTLDLEYSDSNTYSVDWAVYNNTSFIVEGKFVNLKWSGTHDETGYDLVEFPNKQRLFGLNLNSFRKFEFNNFKIKVHYSIGNSEDSINLNFWNSYDSFLNIIEKLFEYLFEFIREFDLRLPAEDSFLKRNGGDASYDIYILKIDNENIKGYTAGEAYIPFTKNTLDISTYLVISNDLDYDWLKTVLFHEFFHSIQSSYDWFESEWISEGLAVAFESIISTNTISPRYFIPHFFEKRNLAISYSGNMTFNYQNLLTTSSLSQFNGEKGDIVLHIADLASYSNRISIYSMNLDDLEIKSFNNNSMKISKISKYVYRGRTILFLKINSDKKTDDLRFELYYKKNLITFVTPAYVTRHYGSFTFFEYLAERYDEVNIFKNSMELSIEYDQLDIIENLIKKINPKSSFIEELINFWVAVELMTSSNKVQDKYRLLKADIWELSYFQDYYDLLKIEDNKKNIIIDNLEPTGCLNFKILFGNKSSAYFNVSKNININDLNFRAIVEYQNGEHNIIEIEPKYSFKLTFNRSVYQIVLLIIANKTFPQNKEILLEYATDIDTVKELRHVHVDHLKFAINVSKKE